MILTRLTIYDLRANRPRRGEQSAHAILAFAKVLDNSLGIRVYLYPLVVADALEPTSKYGRSDMRLSRCNRSGSTTFPYLSYTLPISAERRGHVNESRDLLWLRTSPAQMTGVVSRVACSLFRLSGSGEVCRVQGI